MKFKINKKYSSLSIGGKKYVIGNEYDSNQLKSTEYTSLLKTGHIVNVKSDSDKDESK